MKRGLVAEKKSLAVTGKGARANTAANASPLPAARRRTRPARSKVAKAKVAPVQHRAVIEVKQLRALLGEKALKSLTEHATTKALATERDQGRSSKSVSKISPKPNNKFMEREEEVNELTFNVVGREYEDAELVRLKAELARVNAENEAVQSAARTYDANPSIGGIDTGEKPKIANAQFNSEQTRAETIVQTPAAVVSCSKRIPGDSREGFFGFASQAEQHAAKREKQRLLRLELGTLALNAIKTKSLKPRTTDAQVREKNERNNIRDSKLGPVSHKRVVDSQNEAPSIQPKSDSSGELTPIAQNRFRLLQNSRVFGDADGLESEKLKRDREKQYILLQIEERRRAKEEEDRRRADLDRRDNERLERDRLELLNRYNRELYVERKDAIVNPSGAQHEEKVDDPNIELASAPSAVEFHRKPADTHVETRDLHVHESSAVEQTKDGPNSELKSMLQELLSKQSLMESELATQRSTNQQLVLNSDDESRKLNDEVVSLKKTIQSMMEAKASQASVSSYPTKPRKNAAKEKEVNARRDMVDDFVSRHRPARKKWTKAAVAPTALENELKQSRIAPLGNTIVSPRTLAESSSNSAADFNVNNSVEWNCSGDNEELDGKSTLVFPEEEFDLCR